MTFELLFAFILLGITTLAVLHARASLRSGIVRFPRAAIQMEFSRMGNTAPLFWSSVALDFIAGIFAIVGAFLTLWLSAL